MTNLCSAFKFDLGRIPARLAAHDPVCIGGADAGTLGKPPVAPPGNLFNEDAP